ncbi:Rubredoxin, partial [Dysosmobacter welbionis]
RQKTPCEPPVRPCVEWLGTQQGPSPSRGFWTNLGRFRGSAEDERKCWIKNRRH